MEHPTSSELHDRSAALDHIVNAAGGAPSSLNKAELLADLDFADTLYRTRLELPEQARRRKKHEAIRKAAARLRAHLQDKHSDIGCDTLQEVLSALNRLTKELDSQPAANTSEGAVAAGDAITKALHLNERSAFEWLAGVHLPTLFTKHFGQKPRFSRNKKKVSGRYIGFAEQALAELGILNKGRPYSRGSIAAALTKARAGKRRRADNSEKISQSA